MFTDRVTVDLIAGKGGNGVIAWRRQKYIPKGGPYGGNGGTGGSIWIAVDENIFSLDWFRNKTLLKGENGKQGGTNCRKGANGKDLILKVPPGTLIKSAAGEILYDFVEDGQKALLCRGGRGGRGNASFKSSTNRAPYLCTPGKQGDSLRIELELKLIADIGLVGLPNAGKTTLVNALGHTKAKVGSYPFTTLHPNLGFLQLEPGKRIYIADIPGIIEKAHQNKGLGLAFLRHVERTRLLLFVLSASLEEGADPVKDFNLLQKELLAYKKDILNKPYLIALNKGDKEDAREGTRAFYQAFPTLPTFEISALTGQGLPQLIDKLIAHFQF